jgi:tRNA1Val (adenine37-N6)-methyltransferase
MIFQFKQFAVKQQVSAMKVGTDSVLLGCYCKVQNAKHILDIGTGTGLLALMLAQKSEALIDAVETDEAAATEADFNFSQSPWANRITLHRQRIQEFTTQQTYDVIICNPPYYRHKASMDIADEQRSMARHDKDLPFTALLHCIQLNLKDTGTAWLILPDKEAGELLKQLDANGLYLQHIIYIHSIEHKKPNRHILVLCKTSATPTEQHMAVYDAKGNPTPEYRQLTKDYYLWKDQDKDERLKW